MLATKHFFLHYSTIFFSNFKDSSHNLNLYHTILTLIKDSFENIVGKGENAGNQHFPLFPHGFLPHGFHQHLYS